MKRFACLLVALLCVGAAGTSQAGRIRVGLEIYEKFETPHPYGLADTAAPQRLIAHTLHHPDATYIAPHFSKFHLAEGDYVVVRSPDGKQEWRYEGLGRGGYGLDPRGFFSSRIHGDTAIVELFTRHAEGLYGYSIDYFFRGLDDDEIAEHNPIDPTAICLSDNAEWAKCYEQSEPEAYEEARAVARLHLVGGFLCTGWLVGCEGHLMTNNHCIGSAFEAANADYEFMAEGDTCQTSCFSSSACPGNTENTSGTVVQTNAALDYTLIDLPVDVSGTYGYMTMRPTGPELNERIYIPQHPAGWGKRIAIFSDHSSDQSGYCEVFSLSSPPCTGGPGDVGYYCDTQGGSSGSPVLGYADHKVVSLHHCANCPNRGLNIEDVINSLGDNVPACATETLAGEIDIDRDVFSCSDELGIQVIDDSIQGAGSVSVTLASDSEATPETVILTEQSPGLFSGTFPTGGLPAVPGDGKLSLAHDDTITGVYIDADDGSGGFDVPREDTAASDCQGPQASNVQISGITITTAIVTWDTDEPGSSYVQYGTEPPGSSSADADDVVTNHHVEIDELVDCENHVLSVGSTDELGNFASDDNGGLYYAFTALCSPPTPIPAGQVGSEPLTVERVAADRSELLVHWDDQCAPEEANLLYGSLDSVSTYAIDGARCTVSQPESWTEVPAGDIWFLMVGENGAHLESSWGLSSFGERKGLAGSFMCGATFKNPAGSCP